MNKPYPEQLGEWLKGGKPAQRDQYLVAFLAVSDDVRAALAAGFSMCSIWRHLHALGRIPFCYDTFLKHVHRMQKSSGQAPEHGSLPYRQPGQQARPALPAKDGKASAPRPAPAGFTFNPVPSKEELL